MARAPSTDRGSRLRWTQGAWPPIAIYALLTGIALLIVVSSLLQQRSAEARMIAEVRASPSFGTYGSFLGFYSSTGNYRSGLEAAARLAEEFPDDPKPLLYGQQFAESLQYALNQPVDISLAEQAMQRNGGEAETFASLAELFILYGKLDFARKAIDKALSRAPDDRHVQNLLGQLHKNAGELDLARVAYEHCQGGPVLQGGVGLGYDEMRCAAELIPATRQLTVTLQADRLTIEGHVRFATPFTAISNTLRLGSPQDVIHALAWGNGSVGTADAVYNWSLPSTTRIASDEAWFARTFSYSELFRGNYFGSGIMNLTLNNLPLSAYTSPTTVTISSTNLTCSYASAFTSAGDNWISWRLDQVEQPGKPFSILCGGKFNSFLLPITTSVLWWNSAYAAIRASATIWGLFVLIWARRRFKNIGITYEHHWMQRWLAPQGVVLWLFDGALIILSVYTTLLPFYSLVVQGSFEPWGSPFIASIIVLGVLLLRLAVAGLTRGSEQAWLSTHLGAAIFVCYLIPRLGFENPVFGLLFMLLGAVGYYTFVVGRCDWLYRLEWQNVGTLFSTRRSALIAAISGLSRADEIAATRRDLEQSLAKGLLKAAEYRESLALVEEMACTQQSEEAALRNELGLSTDDDPRRLIFRLGPGATTLANGLYAVAFGIVPFVCFLVFSASQGGIALRDDLWMLLYTTAGVAWGPIFLFFFGYTYRTIIGDFGAVKGLIFSSILLVVTIAGALLWQITPPDPVQLWGDVLRLLVTFVFTGAMMDWAVTGFSWPEIRRSYNSPAFTTIIAVVGTTITTVITALLSGTLSKLLSVAFQSGASALGVPDIGRIDLP